MLAVVLNGCMSSLGALIGFFLKRGISKQYTQAIFGVISLCVTVMGIQAAVATQNLILVLASMIVGTLAGTALHIEDRMQQFGEYLKKRLRAGNESDFVKGFVTLSSMQVIGAMAILGPVQAALGNNERPRFYVGIYLCDHLWPGNRAGRARRLSVPGIVLRAGDAFSAAHDG